MITDDAGWVVYDPGLVADDAGLGAEDEEEEGVGFTMPNWVEYWNWPVPVTMICSP